MLKSSNLRDKKILILLDPTIAGEKNIMGSNTEKEPLTKIQNPYKN